MERWVFFGKGGIGKSTVAANVSATLARRSTRVLHVGCDPKHDSTVALLGGRLLEPVVNRIEHVRGVVVDDIVTRSPLGIDCVEAGGPSAGVGCGGRGVSRMLAMFDEAKLLAPGRYDVAVYDVLGDVVCGGFAAPLRHGVGEKVVIVTSEELMSLYAANNIAQAVVHYAINGIALAGIVANLRDGADGAEIVERFAARIGTTVLATLLRDPLVREAEFRGRTVAEAAPTSAFARKIEELADAITSVDAASAPLPRPLDERTFYALARARFEPATELEPSPGEERRHLRLVPARATVTPDPAAEASRRDLSAPSVVASDEVTARFAQALWLSGSPELELSRVTRVADGSIELLVVGPGGNQTVSLVPPGRPTWIHGPSFGISHRGKTPRHLESTLRRFARRYGNVPLERLREAVQPDPGDQHLLSRDIPNARFFSWASSNAWRSFAEAWDLFRGACSGFGAGVAVVAHTEDECSSSNPETPPGVPSFIVGLRGRRGRRVPDESVSTDLRDRDVILGGEAKLEQTIAAIAQREDRPELVVVQSTCTPMVIGDDVQGAARRMTRRTGLPIVAMDHDTSPAEALLRRLLAGSRDGARRVPGTVAIVGMPTVSGEEELFEWLSDAGVRIAGRVLPDLPSNAIDGVATAASVAIYPWEHHMDAGHQIARALAVPASVVPSPFGPGGSLRWLEAVARLAGRGEAMDRVIQDRAPPHEARWMELRARAARWRLGFVADSLRWQESLAPARRLGVACVPAVEDMGFGVDIFAYAHGASSPAPASLPGERRVIPFASPGDLELLFRTSGVSAVHSDFAFDRRLTRSGVQRFSLDEFRAGPRGAMLTAEALLRLAAVPFFRRYAAYLGQAFEAVS